MGAGASRAARQGWNAGANGAVRCSCATRMLYWANLDRRMGEPCCALPCCATGSGPVAIMATRDEVLRLRARAVRERWSCPRCGVPIAAHWRGFECLDRLVRQIRAFKQARR